MGDTPSDEFDDLDSADFETSPPKPEKPPAERGGLRGRPRRPGEQDPLQSPLVMWLFGGAVVLVIAAAVLWTVVLRYQRNQAYQAAKIEFEADRHRQAVSLYETFLDDYQSGQLANAARRELARARVQKEIDSAVPNWSAGLKRLEELIADFRDDESFENFGNVVYEDARTIALGSAESARRVEEATLLTVHDAAGPIAVRYAPSEESEKLRAQLAKARADAERAIRRRKTHDATTKRMDERLAGGAPLDALDARFDLLDQFSDYADDAELATRFETALANIRDTVSVDLGGRPTEEVSEDTATGVTIVHEVRNRRDRDPGVTAEIVLAYAGGSLFGLDATTGSPVWRRPLGTDRPFFPVETSGVAAGFLAFNGHAGSLERLDLATGRPLWSLPLGGWPSGPPVERTGVLYLATRDGRLLQIEAESGQLLAVADCGQLLSTPPAPIGNGRVAVVGERSVAYVFETAPLAIADVVFLGHRRGAAAGLVQDGPQFERIGPYVLFIENTGVDSARLRLLPDDLVGDPPEPIATATVPGNVYDAVAVRGRRLFVPFGNERVATFMLSAEPGRDPLVPAARLDRERADVPVSIQPGPADEFWMASSSVRRFRVLIEAVQQAPGRTAVGRHVQPIRGIGERLFVAYLPPSESATVVLELDRRTFDVGWRTSLAETFLLRSEPDGSILGASESGRIYVVAAADIAKSTFRRSPSLTVDLDDETEAAGLYDAPNGFVFVRRSAVGDEWTAVVHTPEPDRKTTTFRLPARPVLPPVVLEDGIVIATRGRLSLVPPTGTPIDYDAPGGAETGWRALGVLADGALVAQDDAGGLVRLDYRTQPVAHFGVTARLENVDAATPAGIGGELVVVVDRRNQVTVHSANRFERLGSFPLGAAPVRSPHVLSQLVLVETKDGQLHGYTAGPEAEPPWSIPLDGETLSGPPIDRGNLVLATTRTGRVLRIDPRLGVVRSQTELGTNLAGSPIVVGNRLVVATTDGTIVAVPEPEDGDQP